MQYVRWLTETLYKTMDKALALTVPEKGTTVCQRQLSCLSRHSEKGNTIQQVFLFCFSPLGEKPLFHLFSPSFCSFSQSHSLPVLLLLWKTRFQRVSLELQLRWNDIRCRGRRKKKKKKKTRDFVARPETEFPWRLLPGATQASSGGWLVRGRRSITLDGFAQWLLYLVVINWNHCFIISPDKMSKTVTVM